MRCARDPLFKLGVDRRPLDQAMDLASGPTFSRLENAVSTKDLYRMAQAFVDQFIASYPEAPAVIVIDLDHSEDPTHGQQEFSFYNHYYQQPLLSAAVSLRGTLGDGSSPPPCVLASARPVRKTP